MENAIVVSSTDKALGNQERSDLSPVRGNNRPRPAFVRQVGMALVKIRVQRLYRQEYYGFDYYCRQRWGASRIHAHRCIDAAKVHEMLPEMTRKVIEDVFDIVLGESL